MWTADAIFKFPRGEKGGGREGGWQCQTSRNAEKVFREVYIILVTFLLLLWHKGCPSLSDLARIMSIWHGGGNFEDSWRAF